MVDGFSSRHGSAGFAGVTGSGVWLPLAGSVDEVRVGLAAGAILTGEVRALDAPHTTLPPLQARVGVCPDPEPEAGTRRVPRECRLAVAVASRTWTAWGDSPAASPTASTGAGVGTVWASSTAGMDEYGQICVEAATLGPGLVSPLTGPQAAYNGPAAAVSIALGLTGPQLTVTGGREAGATAVVEACRMLREEQCEHVLVGGSASASRWRMVGVEPGLVPAEGAVCLVLSRPNGVRHPVAARPLRRARLDASDVDGAARQFVATCLDGMAGPPDLVVLSAPPAWRSRAGRALAGVDATRWYVDEMSGDLGAAGGVQAVVAAVAACGATDADASSALVLALGSTGDAVAVEVASPEEWRHGSV
jgi:hypothetical protein